MGRKRIENKNIVVSVSLPINLASYIKTHPKFNFSKFVQIHFQDYVEKALEVEQLKLELEGGE